MASLMVGLIRGFRLLKRNIQEKQNIRKMHEQIIRKTLGLGGWNTTSSDSSELKGKNDGVFSVRLEKEYQEGDLLAHDTYILDSIIIKIEE